MELEPWRSFINEGREIGERSRGYRSLSTLHQSSGGGWFLFCCRWRIAFIRSLVKDPEKKVKALVKETNQIFKERWIKLYQILNQDKNVEIRSHQHRTNLLSIPNQDTNLMKLLKHRQHRPNPTWCPLHPGDWTRDRWRNPCSSSSSGFCKAGHTLHTLYCLWLLNKNVTCILHIGSIPGQRPVSSISGNPRTWLFCCSKNMLGMTVAWASQQQIWKLPFARLKVERLLGLRSPAVITGETGISNHYNISQKFKEVKYMY